MPVPALGGETGASRCRGEGASPPLPRASGRPRAVNTGPSKKKGQPRVIPPHLGVCRAGRTNRPVPHLGHLSGKAPRTPGRRVPGRPLLHVGSSVLVPTQTAAPRGLPVGQRRTLRCGGECHSAQAGALHRAEPGPRRAGGVSPEPLGRQSGLQAASSGRVLAEGGSSCSLSPLPNLGTQWALVELHPAFSISRSLPGGSQSLLWL